MRAFAFVAGERVEPPADSMFASAVGEATLGPLPPAAMQALPTGAVAQVYEANVKTLQTKYPGAVLQLVGIPQLPPPLPAVAAAAAAASSAGAGAGVGPLAPPTSTSGNWHPPMNIN